MFCFAFSRAANYSVLTTDYFCVDNMESNSLNRMKLVHFYTDYRWSFCLVKYTYGHSLLSTPKGLYMPEFSNMEFD